MKALLFALVLSLAPSASFAEACGAFEPDWSACETDADCAPARNACGWPAAYNANHLEDAKRYNACIAPFIECAAAPSSETEGAFCVEKVCASKKAE